MKIGIIIGSIREGRQGAAVAEWVHDAAGARTRADYELIDLKSFDVPLLTSKTHPMASKKQYESEAVNAWSRAIDGCDAYIFVTPEYNHGVPGGLKNAVDCLGAEWVGKAVGFVGYGSAGGVRAVEQWRQVVANFQMVDVRGQLELSMFTDWKDGAFTPSSRRADELTTLFDQLETMAGKLAG